MKKTAKRLTALALSAAMLTAPAGAITADGQSETWFDGVWSLIDAFSIKTEHDPYVLQNYINKYLEKHPEEMYDVINDILGLLDTHSMYLSSEEYSQGFSTLEGFVSPTIQRPSFIGSRPQAACRSARSCAIPRPRRPAFRSATLS